MAGVTSTVMNTLYSNQMIRECLEGAHDRATTIEEGISAILAGRVAVSFQDVPNISTTEMEELAKVVMNSETLLQLDLSNSQITTNGAKLIANGLKFNSTLKELNLSDNVIDDDGALCLLEVLKLKSNIRKLSLKGNYCEDVLRDISRQLSANKRLSITNWEAFKEALENGENGPWNMSKLMIVGQGRAGKTATVNNLLGIPFHQTLSTVGVKLTRSKATGRNSDWKEEQFDPAGFINNVAARIAVKRSKSQVLSRKRSRVPKSKGKKSKRQERDDDLIDDYLIDTSHISQRECTEKFVGMEDIAKRYEETQFTNAPDAISFTIWDYGGQSVFYTLHHLFLSRYGVYLVVFDMRELLTNPTTAMENLKFWLNSIDMHASSAPVLLVGTFHDVVYKKVQLKQIMRLLSPLLKSYPQTIFNRKQRLSFFPLNNTIGESKILREAIVDVTSQQEYIKQEVSLRWLNTLDALLGDNTKSSFKLSEVKRLAAESGVVSSDEVVNMLKLFHQLGVIIYFTATDALRDVVVTNPQWLIDSMAAVIRDPLTHERNNEEIRKHGLEEDGELLYTKGLVSKDLLKYLWNGENVDFLIDLMRRTMLIGDWSFSPTKEVFIVPSMINNIEAIETTALTGFTCDFDFSKHYLPSGVLQRFICLLVAHSSSSSESQSPPELFKESAKVYLNGVRVHIVQEKDCISAILEKGCDDAVPQILQILMASMHKLDVDAMGSGLVWDVKLRAGKGTYYPYGIAKQRRVKPWFHPAIKATDKSSRLMKDVTLEAFLYNT